MHQGVVSRRRATTAVVAAAMLLFPAPSIALSTTPYPQAAVAAAAALQVSADLGHGEKVSRAASAPGGPVVPEGCRNFGHWVSSEARGTTCEENPRPGGPKRQGGPKNSDGSTGP